MKHKATQPLCACFFLSLHSLPNAALPPCHEPVFVTASYSIALNICRISVCYILRGVLVPSGEMQGQKKKTAMLTQLGEEATDSALIPGTSSWILISFTASNPAGRMCGRGVLAHTSPHLMSKDQNGLPLSCVSGEGR